MHSHEAHGHESGEEISLTGDGESTVEQLAAELAAARDALDALRESGLREHADLENQRKRMAREVEQARRFANERVLSDLLPVFDSLEAGLAVETADAAKLREGMELTLRQLGKVAADHGLEPVDPAGADFDPEQHQAISTVASPEHPDGTVVQVFQKGYRLNQRLVRPALVVVSKAPD
ncbi:MAG: nucleotide exchange factor GrpE [Gammaproteobacteria bacterium HGW-Gammaproteobacteria-7]|nr:MAG: nucleotide exchange factor GrpE [Gammaproteobacteria bacterium HGW-Gammaproteobacteria-7]